MPACFRSLNDDCVSPGGGGELRFGDGGRNREPRNSESPHARCVLGWEHTHHRGHGRWSRLEQSLALRGEVWWRGVPCLGRYGWAPRFEKRAHVRLALG